MGVARVDHGDGGASAQIDGGGDRWNYRFGDGREVALHVDD